MLQEIERKFRVKNTTFLQDIKSKSKIVQGYLSSNPDRTVRIRIKNDKGFITIKGRSNDSGTTRLEWEKEIDFQEAHQLMNLCEDFIIEKTRYEVIFQNQLFEIDIFEGKNDGLIIAEIELESENQNLIFPDWLGQEVTGDIRFYNAYLSQKPYDGW
ncbi:CYTH domain-containing protein [Avrilella dinanensis]|uniref:Adenylate cyclase n=1 Tax=Avrilella dinanensis TaxID=2008672 RepID=A0A2M9R3C6_9FLAO|nr:CYTH domain-containing protein [Avrilella dinanensis]PJR03265.1 adenylate cyclase [Avrilella dinanensis]